MSRSPILAIAALAIFAACGGGGGAPGADAGAAGGPVAVSLSEWKIESKPAAVKAGKVTFEIKNTGNLEHNFVITGAGKSPNVLAKDATKLELELKAGSYEVHCDLPGHKEAGMTGRLEVK